MVKPVARWLAVSWVRDRFRVRVRRACVVVNLAESSYRYRSQRKDPEGLRERLLELATERPRFGYRRLHLLLRREGFAVNHKRVQRMYREEDLSVRRKRCKRVAQTARRSKTELENPNERWSTDFMSNSLATGRSFHVFNIVDDFSRECSVIEVDSFALGRASRQGAQPRHRAPGQAPQPGDGQRP